MARRLDIRLTKVSKMPGNVWNLPAAECITGGKLHEQTGTVCSGCYARKGHFRRPNVKLSQYRNLRIVRGCQASGDWEPFVAAFVEAFRSSGPQHFRWHSSGDLQSVEHLRAIVEIARRVPEVSFFLPTKEFRFVRQVGADYPENLVVRLSNPRLDEYRPAPLGLPASGVTSNGSVPKGAWLCPAPEQDGKCADCRACWDGQEMMVVYRKH